VNAETVAALSRLHGPDRVNALEWNYRRFNHSCYRASDPVAFVWSFPNQADREVAAWAAAALAYGRVAAIQSTLRDLNRRWEHQPAAFVYQASAREQQKALKGFFYRWTRETHLRALLQGWAAVHTHRPVHQRIRESGCSRYRVALVEVTRDMRESADDDPGHLLPDPAAGSACKRLAMWLRWMVRKDEIDPGLWADHLNPSGLWVPLDTHMFRIAKQLRLTRRRAPDAEAARRITAAFARMRPDDPVRYDFAITRLGMNTSTAHTDPAVPPDSLDIEA
jgi:uncharacterized protein (TIGR02757 family)